MWWRTVAMKGLVSDGGTSHLRRFETCHSRFWTTGEHEAGALADCKLHLRAS